MSHESVRTSFLLANPKLTLTQASANVASEGKHTLLFVGQHMDGTPFSVQTGPFSGHPETEARRIALGIAPMPAPAPIKGLAQTLRSELADATARANDVALRAKSSVTNLHTVLDTAEGVVNEVDNAAADIQAALGLSTNSGPGGPLS